MRLDLTTVLFVLLVIVGLVSIGRQLYTEYHRKGIRWSKDAIVVLFIGAHLLMDVAFVLFGEKGLGVVLMLFALSFLAVLVYRLVRFWRSRGGISST